MRRILPLLILIAHCTLLTAQRQLTLEVGKRLGTPIAPTMYGVFFEDINYAADGGLYAEMVENRSFEFPQAFQGWDVMGRVELHTERPAFDRNPHYASLLFSGHHCAHTGMQNRGFFGFGLREGMTYDFSVYARTHEAGKEAQLLIELTDRYQNVLASTTLHVKTGEWTRYTATFSCPITEAQGRLRMRLLSEAGIDIDHVSLFPTDNWQGLRADLVQALADLHPGIFRFPGGCIIEGTTLETRYQWKNTVGPAENRPLNLNRWNNTFEGRYAPNYYQSYGLGFYEYFLLCEKIGASPIPVVSVGLPCQFHNHDEADYVPVDQLQPYIQDALDLIEFANGDASTPWGSVRAQMGHPAPFGMRILGIGNEQWGPAYTDRLEPFLKVLRAAHPEIEIVGSSGPFPEGEDFDYGWNHMRRLKTEYVDEHYYQSPEWFLTHATRYDSYDRKGPRVFAGEYAAHVEREGHQPMVKNCFEAALAEAAFMTGLERNADLVRMTAYAPLFCNANAWQWDPDLIWFDNMHVVRTPNYYVQQLFAAHPGTHMLRITENKQPLTGQDGLYASAAYDANDKTYIVRLVNTAEQPQTIMLTGKGLTLSTAHTYALHAEPHDYNSLAQPLRVVPKESDQPVSNGLTVPGQTVMVCIIK